MNNLTDSMEGGGNNMVSICVSCDKPFPHDSDYLNDFPDRDCMSSFRPSKSKTGIACSKSCAYQWFEEFVTKKDA